MSVLDFDPSVYTTEFDQSVCDTFYAAGRKERLQGKPAPDQAEIERSVDALVQLVQSAGMTPNVETIRQYINCGVEGYNNAYEREGSNYWLWVGAIAAVGGIWFAMRK